MSTQRSIQRTLDGSQGWACIGARATSASPSCVRVLIPGSFNPLHPGHSRIAAVAEEILETDVHYELSVQNVDKPDLGLSEVVRRLRQFQETDTVWVTRSPTFVEKSALFPAATFAVGADTIQRVADPRYYQDVRARDEAIGEIAHHASRFLVFGRAMAGSFRELGDLDLPPALRRLCLAVPSHRFRVDLSSTELRREGL